jgi:hypothetical protein
MKAVITGDIILKVSSSLWMKDLKSVLNAYGNEPKDWEIYRGDSFQLVLILLMLVIALLLKATIKQHKALDVRMAIGIGTIDYTSNKVTESNGSAFINSGECFGLKKQTLGIQTPWSGFDETFTIILQLVVLFADKWTTTSAEIIKKH